MNSLYYVHSIHIRKTQEADIFCFSIVRIDPQFAEVFACLIVKYLLLDIVLQFCRHRQKQNKNWQHNNV